MARPPPFTIADRSGDVAIITGANSGIGFEAAAALAGAGATVIMACRDRARGERARAELPAGLDRRVTVIPLDVTSRRSIEEFVERFDAEFDHLDLLINNAGVMRRGPITEATDEDLALSLAVNVEAPFRICRAAIPLLAMADQSAIVNVASCWGVHPGPNHLVYCMTKAALASMTQCLGRDHAHQGIRVNGVCPNEVDTPMLRTGFEVRGLDPATAISDLDKTVPLGRVAQPSDIADVVIFLCSEQARYMCGSLVEVNGGKPVS